MRNTLARLLGAAAAALLSGCALFRGGDDAPPEDGGVSFEPIPLDAEVPGLPAPEVQAKPEAAPPLVVYDLPSPNFDRRTLPVSMIVLHYTAAPLAESLNALRNNRAQERVSAHYVVAENGDIYRLVDESRRAWHAGVARWGRIGDVNSASIGIEIVNLGHDRNGRALAYPKAQVDAVIRLCQNIQRRYRIASVIGHSDVAPTRKVDPGERFPWKTLAAQGVGVWTDGYQPTSTPISALLRGIGYDTRNLYMAVQAFRRHYDPNGLVTRDLDATTQRAAAVAALLR